MAMKLDPRHWNREEWVGFGESLTQSAGILLAGVAVGGSVALKLAFQKTCTPSPLAPCYHGFQAVNKGFVTPTAVAAGVVLLGGFALAARGGESE